MQAADSVEDLSIRLAKVEDASLIIEGLIRCYGESYPNPSMYQEEIVEALIQQGQMHSVIALNLAGEVVGHCALSYEHPDDRVPEAGKLFVDPRYRGRHLSDLLAKERKAHAMQMNLSGFWAACVTNHPYSQLEIISLGGSETGLLINGQPNTVHMDGLKNIGDSRHSLIPYYVSLKPCHGTTVNLPEYHHDFFIDLLKHTGLTRKIGEKVSASKIPTSLSVHHSAEGKPSHIKVLQIGDDFLRKTELIIKNLSSEKHPVIYLDMPMTHALAAEAIIELETLGFFWGAWLPGYGLDGDILRLQCLLDKTVNQTDVVCARPEAALIKDFIMSEWRRVSLVS